MIEESINTTALFSVEDIKEATKQSNFNKGLGPDCFDGNLLTQNDQLGVKVMTEIADALNNSQIMEKAILERIKSESPHLI